MLISILVTFLLSREFTGKTYLFLAGAFLIFISILSFGLPMRSSFQADSQMRNHYYLPFSFPFYSINRIQLTELMDYWESYKIYFLTFEIAEFNWNWDRNNSWSPSPVLGIYSFFLLINIVDAMVGYWISTRYGDVLGTDLKDWITPKNNGS